jgi:hypothetical protein
MIYPISFSVPREMIVDSIPEKTKVLATCIPGKHDTYVFENETDYYQDYRNSMFALTTKKGGWDCYRHYEILANGCIPVFPDLIHCPALTMTTFPRKLIFDANDIVPKHPEQYNEWANKLLEYTKANLTTDSTARYILSVCGKPIEGAKVLFLSESTGYLNNYLRCLTLHGFRTLLGANCHDYPRVNHMYKDYDGGSWNLWGKGFGCSRLLNAESRDASRDSTIEEDIRNRYYDLIVYGNIHLSTPLRDLVDQYYPPSSVALLCGDDSHEQCPLFQYAPQGYRCFMREIPV